MLIFIPLRNIHLHELNNDYYWIIDKIAYILFSNSFNDYAVKTARSILEFILKANLITCKQAKIINELKPNKY